MIVSSPEETEDGISKVAHWFWRWKYTIFTPIIVSVFLAITTYITIPAQYTSQAVLVLDARQRQVLPGVSLVSQLPQEGPVVKTELDIISSRNTAAHVIDLLADRGVALVPPVEKSNPVVLVVRTVTQMIGASIVTARTQDEKLSDTRRTRASVDDILAGLHVSNDGRSYTIYIEYTSRDAEFAAATANAFADAYLEKQLAIYEETAAKARVFLGPRVKSLRNQLAETELKRQSRRQAAGLTPDGGAELLVGRLADLNSELASVRAAIAEAHARLETARDGAPALGTSVDSPQIQTLMTEKSAMENERAHLIEKGALKSQILAEIEQDLDGIDQQIAEEYQRILGRLTQEIMVQERKQVILATEIEKMREALDKSAGAMIEVAQLDREVEASSAIYESYLSRYKETVEQQGIAIPDARLISAAEPGVREGFGRLAKWLMGSFVFGGMVGGMGALGRSAIEARRATPTGLAEKTGVSAFGYLPRLTPSQARAIGSKTFDPASAWGAAVTFIQMNLPLPSEDGSCTAVAVTSVANGDGKTTVAIGLVQSLVASGARLLLIDCDTQKPNIAQRLRISKTRLKVAQTADAPILTSETLQSAPWGGDVFVLADNTARRSIVLDKRHLAAVIDEARAKYDVIVLDCPALNERPEAACLAATAELAIHVVRWPRSRMSDVQRGLDELASIAQRQRVGVVFTRWERMRRIYGAMQDPPTAAMEA